MIGSDFVEKLDFISILVVVQYSHDEESLPERVSRKHYVYCILSKVSGS